MTGMSSGKKQIANVAWKPGAPSGDVLDVGLFQDPGGHPDEILDSLIGVHALSDPNGSGASGEPTPRNYFHDRFLSKNVTDFFGISTDPKTRAAQPGQVDFRVFL